MPLAADGGAAANVLAVSDVGLRALEGRGAPLAPPLFVHFDLPTRKVRIRPASRSHLMKMTRASRWSSVLPGVHLLLPARPLLARLGWRSSILPASNQPACIMHQLTRRCCSSPGGVHAAGGGGEPGARLERALRHRRVFCRRREGRLPFAVFGIGNSTTAKDPDDGHA